ncbi:MAG: flagellar basal body rod protein FlgC [Steroidobacteraceae bacterium]
MPSFNIFDIAGSGMSAQTVRLNTTASNLANADSVASSADAAYKARHPVFKAVQAAIGDTSQGQSVQVTGISQNQAKGEARYEPGNPLANADGYVYGSNVNVVEEMVDMISASRSYQNNVEVMNTSKELMLATLKLGQ